MFAWLTASVPDRRLLSDGRLRGPTLYVIAIMTFAMIVVAAAGLALSNAAGIVARGVESRYAIQLTPDFEMSEYIRKKPKCARRCSAGWVPAVSARNCRCRP